MSNICTWQSEGEDWIPSCNKEIEFFKGDVDTLWGALPKGSDFHCPNCTKKVETVGDPDMCTRYEKKPNRFLIKSLNKEIVLEDTQIDSSIFTLGKTIATWNIDRDYRLLNQQYVLQSSYLLKLLNDYVPHKR